MEGMWNFLCSSKAEIDNSSMEVGDSNKYT